MRRLVFAIAGGALLLVVVGPMSALACSTDLLPVSRIASEADRIVLGRVTDRVGDGTWTYTIEVERVIKGGSLPPRWVIKGAGASDCGMPRLDSGERVVLEFYDPGRMYAGPWFYAWKIEPDGTVAFSDIHEPPLPRTLDELLSRYAAAGLPDTATDEPAQTPVFPILMIVGLIGGIAMWHRTREVAARGRDPG